MCAEWKLSYRIIWVGREPPFSNRVEWPLAVNREIHSSIRCSEPGPAWPCGSGLEVWKVESLLQKKTNITVWIAAGESAVEVNDLYSSHLREGRMVGTDTSGKEHENEQ